MKLRMPHYTSRGTPENFHKMILLSALVHFVVLGLVFASIPGSSRRITFGPIYSVSLVGADVALTGSSPGLSDFIPQSESPGSSFIKREFEPAPPAPLKKDETERLNVEKAIESLKQREAARPQENTTATQANAGAAAPAGEKSAAGDQAAAQRNEYIALVWARVKGNWTLPQALMPKDGVETIIDVRISRSGALEHIGFEKRSGYQYFDDSALNAVKKSTPFPPLPSYITSNHIEIGIRFHSRELR